MTSTNKKASTIARRSTTITIDVRAEQACQLKELHSTVPIASVHAVARAVFQQGLDDRRQLFLHGRRLFLQSRDRVVIDALAAIGGVG